MTLLSPFARRVAGVFATRITRFVVGLAISLLLARILAPAGRGQYALLVLLPGMLMALGQLGLPSAISFFAGRGRSGRDLERLALLLALVLSLVLVGVTALALPWVASTLLEPAPEELLAVSLAGLPFQFVAAFTGAALIGRQRMRNYNVILVGQSLLMLALVVVLVLVLDLGVTGAAISYASVAVATATATAIELRRVVREESAEAEDAARSVATSQLVGYGLRIYPASVAGYFSYRSDVLLLSAILADPVPIGIYTFAVSLAELTFFIPDSVSTVFFPRVAGMERAGADALAPQVSRFTVLVTALAALALIPTGYVGIRVLLPDYVDSFAPFLVLMPGIVALSISKVLSGYLGGLDLPLSVAAASGLNLVVNVIANLLLIPVAGVVGAALASCISYAVHAAMLVTIASRLSRQPPAAYVIPTGAEMTRLTDGIGALLRRVRPGAAA